MKEYNKSYVKEYYIANREKLAKYQKDNPEISRKATCKYRKANPETDINARHKRRAIIKQVGGLLSKGLTEKLMILQKGKCAVCKQPVKDGHHLDHIMPIKLGGTNTDDNIQILCPSCNLSKGAKHPQDFMMSRGFLL